MRVNQILYSKPFISFVNTMAFILSICCFLLVILLPLPYHREPPGTISLATDPNIAPYVIVICVVIPFQMGIIFQLIYKLTYKKSKQELLNELGENVKFGYITNETKWDWELDVENNALLQQKRIAELKKKRRDMYQEIKNKEKELEKQVQEIDEFKGDDLINENTI